MKFEDSKYSKLLPFRKEEFSFGTFYFTKYFMISEINQGVHIDAAAISELVERISDQMRKNKGRKIGYIANRFNQYSIDPNLWQDFDSEYNFLAASAVVYYSELSFFNATLEQQFFDKTIGRFNFLDDAIEWMHSIKEFNLKFK